MDERVRTFYELTERRRSVREFAPRPIEPAVLARLFTTLRRAQSAANRQPWHFVVMESEGREALNECLHKEGFRSAPVIIVACAAPDEAWVRKADGVNYAWVDVTIAVTEMITAATAEGLGACWIAAIDPERVKEATGIPDGIEVVGLVAMGYPASELVRVDKPRKPLEEIMHYGRW
ncbi:MAG: nitroreductase family protein [Thermodesulfobacteriota bacterium]